MTLHVSTPVDFWWFPTDQTAKIAAAISGQGRGAFLKLELYTNAAGLPALRWSVVTAATVVTGVPPGGNDSNVCPPDCP
jgi:hypothetical protein